MVLPSRDRDSDEILSVSIINSAESDDSDDSDDEGGNDPASVVAEMKKDRIRRNEVITDADREEYLEAIKKQYPWAFVDFEIEDSHINDATNGEHHKTPGPETHLYARPSVCEKCRQY